MKPFIRFDGVVKTDYMPVVHYPADAAFPECWRRTIVLTDKHGGTFEFVMESNVSAEALMTEHELHPPVQWIQDSAEESGIPYEVLKKEVEDFMRRQPIPKLQMEGFMRVAEYDPVRDAPLANIPQPKKTKVEMIATKLPGTPHK